MRHTGSKGTKVALLNETGTVLKQLSQQFQHFLQFSIASLEPDDFILVVHRMIHRQSYFGIAIIFANQAGAESFKIPHRMTSKRNN